MRQHSINGMGGRPRWRSAAPKVLSGRENARQAHPGRHVAGAGPLSGEGRTTRDPELVAHAQRAATRLESAWEQWRAAWTRGRARTAGLSYVGYSLKEPWVSLGSSSESTPTRPSTWPNSSTAMNAHS